MNNSKTRKGEKLTIIMHKCKTKFNKATQIISHIPVVRIRILIGMTVVRIRILIGTTVVRIASAHWAEIHKYYEECDWSKKWPEGLQKILT